MPRRLPRHRVRLQTGTPQPPLAVPVLGPHATGVRDGLILGHGGQVGGDGLVVAVSGFRLLVNGTSMGIGGTHEEARLPRQFIVVVNIATTLGRLLGLGSWLRSSANSENDRRRNGGGPLPSFVQLHAAATGTVALDPVDDDGLARRLVASRRCTRCGRRSRPLKRIDSPIGGCRPWLEKSVRTQKELSGS